MAEAKNNSNSRNSQLQTSECVTNYGLHSKTDNQQNDKEQKTINSHGFLRAWVILGSK